MTIPNIFATKPVGNVPASELDDNFTYVNNQGLISALNFSGVYPDVSTDSYAGLQSAITASEALGKKLFIPAGTYQLSQTLVKSSSYSGLDIVGENRNSTILNYNGASGTPAIRIIGGSGALCGSAVEDVGFTGAAGSWGVEIQGQCGQDVRHCRFGTGLAYGVVYHNYSSGMFTEYCQADSCDVYSNSAIYYKVTSGNTSFNGSGLANNCTVNAIGTNPVVVIDNQANPYNAPLSLQLWTTSAVTLIENNNTGIPALQNCTFYGNIRFEANAQLTLASGPRNYFSGSIVSNTDAWGRGTLQIVEQITYGVSGNPSVLNKPYTVSQSGVVTGTAVPFLNNGSENNGINYGYLLHVTLIGANYRWSELLAYTAANGAGGSSTLAVLATTSTFNVTGWGAPTYSLNGSDQLVVTNASGGFTVTANIGVTQIGSGTAN